MSIVNTESIPVYGAASQKPNSGDAIQAISETFAVSTTTNARMVKAPKRGGRFTFHYFNETASGATSALTVWYSNLPNPDPTNDAHWVQDSNITAIDMTTTAAGSMINVGNVFAQWVRFKPAVVTTAGKGWLWYRAEGTEI